MVQYTPATDRYWKTPTGKNCPVGQVVLTPNDCRSAAKELGMIYRWIKTRKNRPAGCFFYEENLYFNQETNPLVTNPPFLSNKNGAVCTKGILTLFEYLCDNIICSLIYVYNTII